MSGSSNILKMRDAMKRLYEKGYKTRPGSEKFLVLSDHNVELNAQTWEFEWSGDGAEIVQEFRFAGLGVEWNGSPLKTIRVYWMERRTI